MLHDPHPDERNPNMTTDPINGHRTVGVDLETTGLSSVFDLTLEVALIVLDEDLVEIAAHSWLVPMNPDVVDLRLKDPVVRRMHTESGLLAEHREDTVRLSRLGLTTPEARRIRELEAVRFLVEHDAVNAPMLGNNVGFDRAFLETELPDLADVFHYRNIDVSTVKELARRFAPAALATAPPKAAAHRALDDIRESAAELRHYIASGLMRQETPDAGSQDRSSAP